MNKRDCRVVAVAFFNKPRINRYVYHVDAIRQLGLDNLIAAEPSRQRNLVLAMIIQRQFSFQRNMKSI
ncbi:MAG: hypothetical protein LBT05_14315 [Planctomycetaceae bacterium]|nr:hypothetical protein [Planctomycetaceae bacterium]